MAKVNIFISSTCYDLSQIRDDIKQCIEDLGHNPILSEMKNFPIDPKLSSMENCINAVKKEADIFVLIIGNKYGSVLESGKSITNTEFLTAINKGIPIYTFALKQMTALLPVWERNPEADFTYVVDNNKVFEFLADVRKKRGLWNFEFEKAQDVTDILKVQLSNLFHDALQARQMIAESDMSELYSKVSISALNILLKKEEYYEVKFFMQAMMDEIHKYKDLKNDYEYSIRLKPVNRISDISQLIEWIQLKLGQAQNYIDTLNGLTEAFRYFYAEPGNPSDMEGLYYVARSYAKTYANLLEWGIDVKSTIVPEEYKKLLSAFAKIPIEAIGQIEDFPVASLKSIEEIKEKGDLREGSVVNLQLNISISDETMQRYNEEFEILKNKAFLDLY